MRLMLRPSLIFLRVAGSTLLQMSTWILSFNWTIGNARHCFWSSYCWANWHSAYSKQKDSWQASKHVMILLPNWTWGPSAACGRVGTFPGGSSPAASLSLQAACIIDGMALVQKMQGNHYAFAKAVEHAQSPMMVEGTHWGTQDRHSWKYPVLDHHCWSQCETMAQVPVKPSK